MILKGNLLGSDCARARARANGAKNYAQYVMRNAILRNHRVVELNSARVTGVLADGVVMLTLGRTRKLIPHIEISSAQTILKVRFPTIC